MAGFLKPKLLTTEPPATASENNPHIICEAHLGKMFSRAIMATIRIAPGHYVDVLFDCYGEPMSLQSFTARQVANFFDKSFVDYKILDSRSSWLLSMKEQNKRN